MHALRSAQKESLSIDRMVWVVVRSGKWITVLTPTRGDKALAGFRCGVFLYEKCGNR